jgi:N-methylhydantoinase A
MPFGGGGSLHTGALIKDVGLRSALVPRFPGVTSALGCVVADMRHDRVQTVNRLLSEIDAEALGAEMARAAEETEALVRGSGTTFERVDCHYEFDMLYLGQTHTVAVPVEMGEGLTRETMQAAFDAAYRAAFGRLLEGIPVRVMNYRVTVIGRRPAFDMALFAPEGGVPADEARIATRQVYAEGAWHAAGIYDRLALAVGEAVAGPAILEQPDTTIFVDPGLTARVDRFGNLIIERTQ